MNESLFEFVTASTTVTKSEIEIIIDDCWVMKTAANMKSSKIAFKIFALAVSMIVFLDSFAQAGEKGRDIIIYNGKVILKSSKKKGNNIIIGGHDEGQGGYKYKKKYMNYGGFWR